MLEEATWPLRKLVWKIEEKVLWPIADAFRGWTGRSFAHTRVEAAPEIVTEPPAGLLDGGSEKVKRPLMPRTRARLRARVARIGKPGRELLVVLGTVGVAAAVGIGIAKLAGGPSIKQTPATTQVGVASPGVLAPPPTSAATKTPPGQAKLQGVAPNFNSKPTPANSNSATANPAATTPSTNGAPTTIPPGVGADTAALGTARTFASAFVLYEVGKSSPAVRHSFAITATPTLAKALRDRPPRLPAKVKVPKAKVQNVVLGTRTGNQVQASVALLRVGNLSELRLILTDHRGKWLVSEVRG